MKRQPNLFGRSVVIQLLLGVSSFLSADLPEGYFFTNIKPVAGLEGNWRDSGPHVTENGLTLYFASARPNISNSIVPGERDLWIAIRGSTDEPFGEPVRLSAPTNLDEVEDYEPYVSQDGRALYFTSSRPASEGGINANGWVATRASIDAEWGEPEQITGELNSLADVSVSSFTLSPDQRVIYFHSNRDGTRDLFQAKRDSVDAPFGPAVPLVDVNAERDGELNPSVSSDELAVFFDRSANDSGVAPAILVSTRSSVEEPFGEPFNINQISDTRINVGLAAFSPFVTSDWPSLGSKLYFGSASSFRDFDLMEATWVPEPSALSLFILTFPYLVRRRQRVL